MGSYRKGRGQEPLLKQESERRAGGLKNPRGQTDSAVTHKVESTTNSTGGCSVSYFMDECTVGFGDHATPRPLPPPSTTTARRQVSISRTSSFGQAPRKTFMAPPKHSVLPDPQILGETAQPLSRIQIRQDLAWGWIVWVVVLHHRQTGDSRRETRWMGMGQGHRTHNTNKEWTCFTFV